MDNQSNKILGDFANYLNEMAIGHKLFSASTASAFCYMLEDEMSLKRLQRLISLVLKIKEEHHEIASTSFYQSLELMEQLEVNTMLETMEKAILEPLSLDSTLVTTPPTSKNFVQIGRSAKPEHGNDIVFQSDKTLSRVHLVVTVEEGEFFIEDRSANGTFVNGIKIEKGVKHLVTPEDKVSIGRENTLLDFKEKRIQQLLA